MQQELLAVVQSVVSHDCYSIWGSVDVGEEGRRKDKNVSRAGDVVHLVGALSGGECDIISGELGGWDQRNVNS